MAPYTFATNPANFDEAFAKAWHKLTTRAFGANKAPRSKMRNEEMGQRAIHHEHVPPAICHLYPSVI
jgi:catalase (peroxidase I)